MKSQMFPTRKEVWLNDRIPHILFPLVWLFSCHCLVELYGGPAFGFEVFIGCVFGVPMLMGYLMRIGEYIAIKSLIERLDYYKIRGSFGESNFDQVSKQFILEWWESNSKPYLR